MKLLTQILLVVALVVFLAFIILVIWNLYLIIRNINRKNANNTDAFSFIPRALIQKELNEYGLLFSQILQPQQFNNHDYINDEKTEQKYSDEDDFLLLSE